MSKKIQGTGRLVPTRLTGVEYKVNYGIDSPQEVAAKHGGGWGAAKGGFWTKCSIRSKSNHPIPDGSYFLHGDDGRVVQLKSEKGQWQYLAMM